MPVRIKNNAVATLAANIASDAVSLTVDTGQGALFPSLVGDASDWFYASIVDSSSNREIVKVTARSSDTFTIVRAQDGTTARAFADGDIIELRPVAAIFDNIPQLDADNTLSGDTVVTGSLSIQGNAATERMLGIKTGSELRWDLGAEDTAEGGSDAGSNFEIRAYDDDGVLIDEYVTINRATGAATILGPLTVSTGPLTIGSNKADAFPAGTKMVFRQTAAPTGWTKDTTYTDAALRVTSGTISQQASEGNEFSSVFTTRTISQANLPNVTLSVTGTTNNPGNHSHVVNNLALAGTGLGGGGSSAYGAGMDKSTTSAGGHTHTVTGTTSSINGGVTQTSMNFAVNYVDLIIATKDA